MPDYNARNRNSRDRNSSTSTGTGTGSADSSNARLAAAVETLNSGSEEEKEQVVVYLTQNSVTHHKDEVPETLAALQRADQLGMGKKSLIPISDPYKGGHATDQYAFGENTASQMTWWHSDPSLKLGSVRVNGVVLELGPDHDNDLTDEQLKKISMDWLTALQHVGLNQAKAAAVVSALLRDEAGNYKLTDSGTGASNELLQLISVLNRAEMGEFEISALVLSGHHYEGDDFMFGELPGHEYDDANVTGDTLNFEDIESLSKVFPKAYAQIDSVMFSSCNTHEIGQEDKDGNPISTNDWLEGVFPGVENASLWQETAPGSDFGAYWSGEFMLDVARKESGDQAAYDDARFRKTNSGSNHRLERNADGQLEEIPIKKNSSSYTYNDYKGYRGTNHEAFYKRPDLMKYVHKKK